MRTRTLNRSALGAAFQKVSTQHWVHRGGLKCAAVNGVPSERNHGSMVATRDTGDRAYGRPDHVSAGLATLGTSEMPNPAVRSPTGAGLVALPRSGLWLRLGFLCHDACSERAGTEVPAKFLSGEAAREETPKGDPSPLCAKRIARRRWRVKGKPQSGRFYFPAARSRASWDKD